MYRASAELSWIPSISMLGVCVRICISLLCGVVFSEGGALLPSLEFATSYESHAQFTTFDKDKNATMFLQEYYDLEEKVGRLDFVKGGAKEQHFYYVKLGFAATFNVKELKCTLQPIADLVKALGFESMYDSGVIGPSSWLWSVISPNSTLPDPGEFVLRGIPCIRKTFDPFNGESVITYYISSSNWTTVHGLKESVPVRIEYSEQNVTKWMLDFTFFDVNIDSSLASIFLIPLHIGCPNRTLIDMELITMDDTEILYYADEVTDLYAEKEKTAAITTLERTWIDERNRLIKFDSIHKFTAVSYSEILDFNTGVLYETNNVGVCNMKPIYDSPIFEKQFKGSTGKLKNATEILFLDHGFNHLGQTLHRNIHCDVFEAIEYGYTYDDKLYQRMVFTYFVTTPEYKSSAARYDSNPILVALVMTGYPGENTKATMQYERDFFDFRKLGNWPKSSGINIENCFTEQGRKKYFAVYFPVNDETRPLVEQDRNLFLAKAKKLVMKVASISFLRLPYFKVYLDMENVTIVGEMLDRPPVLAGFLSKKSSGFIKGQQGPMKKANEEECAIACESTTMCRGFTYCEKEEVQDCYLTTDGVKDDTSIQPKEGCTNYNRAVIDSNLNEATLDVALKNLFKQVLDKKFLVQVIDAKGVKHEVKATKMDKDVHPFDAKTSRSKYEEIYKERQLVHDGHTTFEIPEIVESEALCFHRCLNSLDITCNSFSYCPKSRKCFISLATLRNVSTIERDDLTSESTLCNVFLRKSLDLFSQTPGLVPLSRGDKAHPGVGADACATFCLDEKEFACQGFETCDNQCILHKKHILDVITSDTPAAPSCTHYYLNYTLSMRYVSNILVKDTITTLREIRLDECAKECFDPTLKCRSINYCPEVPGHLRSTCDINTKNIFDPGVNTAVSEEACHNYERRDLVPVVTPAPPTPPTPETPKTTTMSDSTDKTSPDSTQSSSITDSTAGTGETTVETLVPEKHVPQGVAKSTFAGVVIGMLIVGIVFGVLGFLGYSYYRSRRADDGISVRFTRHTS